MFRPAQIISALFLIGAASSHSLDRNQKELDFFNLSIEEMVNVIVISATRSESELQESPVPISVISAKDIANSGLDNVPDILARLAEIDLLRIGQSQTEVSIRGKGVNANRRLLTMIDGRTEYNDLFGVTLWHALPISVDDIERIEVVRGPASALFGANAYSGVINIITKQADDDTHNSVRLHAGTNNRHYVNLQWRNTVERNSFKASLSLQNLDNDTSDVSYPGFNRFPTTSNFESDDESLDNSFKANFQWIYKPNKALDLSLAAGGSDGNYEFMQQPGRPRDDWDIVTNYVHWTSTVKLEDDRSLKLSAYANHFDYETRLVPVTSALDSLAIDDGHRYYPSLDAGTTFDGTVNTRDISLEINGSSLNAQMHWLAGAEYRKISNSGGLVVDKSKSITSVFGNTRYKFSNDMWQFSLGLRADRDSITRTDMGYTISLSRFLNKSDLVRVTARRAFRAPSLLEQFSEVDLSVRYQNQFIRFRGNDELNVETIDSYDLTYSFTLNDNLQITAELYHEEYGDFIGNPDSGILENVIFEPDVNRFVTSPSFQNLVDAESSGFQISSHWILNSNLTVYGNYRYVNSIDLNSLPGETFFTPVHKANLGGVWKVSQAWEIDFSINLVGKTDNDEFKIGDLSQDGPNFTRDNQEAYSLANLTLHFQPGGERKFGFYASAQNILNDEHVEYYEYDQVLRVAGEEFGAELWVGFIWEY